MFVFLVTLILTENFQVKMYLLKAIDKEISASKSVGDVFIKPFLKWVVPELWQHKIVCTKIFNSSPLSSPKRERDWEIKLSLLESLTPWPLQYCIFSSFCEAMFFQLPLPHWVCDTLAALKWIVVCWYPENFLICLSSKNYKLTTVHIFNSLQLI